MGGVGCKKLPFKSLNKNKNLIYSYKYKYALTPNYVNSSCVSYQLPLLSCYNVVSFSE